MIITKNDSLSTQKVYNYNDILVSKVKIHENYAGNLENFHNSINAFQHITSSGLNIKNVNEIVLFNIKSRKWRITVNENKKTNWKTDCFSIYLYVLCVKPSICICFPRDIKHESQQHILRNPCPNKINF